MRRLIAVVIIGIGIAIAIIHLRKRENRYAHKKVEVPANSIKNSGDNLIASFPLPVLLVMFLVNRSEEY